MAWKVLPLVLPMALAFECSPSAFQALLPSTATVLSAIHIPDNSTYNVPASNIAYPVSPTQLRALCAVHINVTSSSTSAYGFGLFLPDDWNDRFLAVGNGGFAGGVNWLDMVNTLNCKIVLLLIQNAGSGSRLWFRYRVH